MAAVEDKITGNGLDAIGPQVPQQQPELFHVELWITAALEVKVAVQRAVLNRPVSIEFCFPLMVGPEQFQRGVRRDQLHGRSGVD